MNAPKAEQSASTAMADANSPAGSRNDSSLLSEQTRSDASIETWLFPDALANELRGVGDLSEETIHQTLAVA